MQHRVSFLRSVHNVSLEQITTAAKDIGLHNATITLEKGPKGSDFWKVEADEELEVLMDVSESSGESSANGS